MRVVFSDHPRFTEGTRFDFGYLEIANQEGYTVEIFAGDLYKTQTTKTKGKQMEEIIKEIKSLFRKDRNSNVNWGYNHALYTAIKIVEKHSNQFEHLVIPKITEDTPNYTKQIIEKLLEDKTTDNEFINQLRGLALLAKGEIVSNIPVEDLWER